MAIVGNSACREANRSVGAAQKLRIVLPELIVNGMLGLIVGCLKWAAVGFVVAFVLMKLYEGSHIHDDVPRPDFKVRQSRRAALVLSTFAGMLSGLVWLLVQKWD